MFNIIHVPSGLKVDVIVSDCVGFDKLRLDRARRREFLPGMSAVFSSAEDVIVNKMRFYREGGSDKHLRDIAGMLKISGSAIDREYVERWAASFGVQDVWRVILERVQQSKGGSAGGQIPASPPEQPTR